MDHGSFSGNDLRDWRLGAEITQQEAADLLECSRRSIINWEAYEAGILPPKIAKYLIEGIRQADIEMSKSGLDRRTPTAHSWKSNFSMLLNEMTCARSGLHSIVVFSIKNTEIVGSSSMHSAMSEKILNEITIVLANTIKIQLSLISDNILDRSASVTRQILWFGSLLVDPRVIEGRWGVAFINANESDFSPYLFEKAVNNRIKEIELQLHELESPA